MEKNKTLNFQHLKNVILVKEAVLNPDMMLGRVQCVVVMDKLDQVKVFLLFNKHVLNVLDQEKRLQIHVLAVMDKEKNKLQKDYL